MGLKNNYIMNHTDPLELVKVVFLLNGDAYRFPADWILIHLLNLNHSELSENYIMCMSSKASYMTRAWLVSFE